MKKTLHYTGHRWTTAELTELMKLWAAKTPLLEIADKMNVTRAAVMKMISKLRKNGIPLPRRRCGHIAGRANELWTQGEVEYLIRRRHEKATSEEIGEELGRTWSAVSGMIGKLRSENVPIAMRGMGVRRLWNANALKAVTLAVVDPNVLERDPDFFRKGVA